MMRDYLCLIMVVLLSVTSRADAFPADHTPNSEYSIDYSDLDKILRGSVLPMGRSTHKPPKQRRVKYTASRIQIGNLKHTRQEGNRLMLHGFGDPERLYLAKLRDQLLAVPDDLPLSLLNRNQQLAYFLNLHTSIVLAEIAKEYPITYLNSLYDTDDPEAFINQRKFKLFGQTVSLADIQKHVITNWNDPLVIYGFYFGAVGTPNLRTEVYDSCRVYRQLRDNAEDFVNSMRGTQIWRTSELQVATYYDRMSSAFPNFERDVRHHIRLYANDDFKARMDVTSRITVKIQDWNIADLYNGRPFSDPGGRYPKVLRTVEGVSFKRGLPEHAARLLEERRRKLYREFLREGGNVDIEELPPEEPVPDDVEEKDDGSPVI